MLKTKDLENVAEMLKQWLKFHNLPNWSISAGWLVVVIPAIIVAHFKVPLLIVLLLGISGFAGLMWLIRKSVPSDCGQLSENAVNLDPGVELLNEEVSSDHEISSDNPDEESLNHVADEDNERIAITSNAYAD